MKYEVVLKETGIEQIAYHVLVNGEVLVFVFPNEVNSNELIEAIRERKEI